MIIGTQTEQLAIAVWRGPAPSVLEWELGIAEHDLQAWHASPGGRGKPYFRRQRADCRHGIVWTLSRKANM